MQYAPPIITGREKRSSLWRDRMESAVGHTEWKNIQFCCTVGRANEVKKALKKIRVTLPHRYSLRVISDPDASGMMVQARVTGPREK